jgi:hypothetical protein
MSKDKLGLIKAAYVKCLYKSGNPIPSDLIPFLPHYARKEYRLAEDSGSYGGFSPKEVDIDAPVRDSLARKIEENADFFPGMDEE